MLDHKVLIADKHPVVRAGLQVSIRLALASPTIVEAGTLGEAEAAISKPGRFRLAICGPDLPDASGLSCLMRLQYKLPRVPVVLLLARENRALTGDARSFGAAGVLLKTATLDEISDDLTKIIAGISVFPPHSLRSEAASLRDRLAALSQAQRRVLFAVANGSANKKIAYDLAITEATVKAHMTAIFRQLNVTNRVQLMIKMQSIFGEAIIE